MSWTPDLCARPPPVYAPDLPVIVDAREVDLMARQPYAPSPDLIAYPRWPYSYEPTFVPGDATVDAAAGSWLWSGAAAAPAIAVAAGAGAWTWTGATASAAVGASAAAGAWTWTGASAAIDLAAVAAGGSWVWTGAGATVDVLSAVPYARQWRRWGDRRFR
jgi:hypothetical protein